MGAQYDALRAVAQQTADQGREQAGLGDIHALIDEIQAKAESFTANPGMTGQTATAALNWLAEYQAEVSEQQQMLRTIAERESLASNAVQQAQAQFRQLSPDLLSSYEANVLAKQDEVTLRSGEVVGCVTSHPHPPPGCISQPLGQMRYHFYATPDFVRSHLPDGLTREAVLATPGIAFNRKDSLHFGQMEARFGLRLGDYPYLTMPSTHALFEAVKAGLGYGLSPELQVGEALASGEVIDLLPDDPPSVSLYWHGWALQSPRLARFTATLVAEARQRLRGG